MEMRFRPAPGWPVPGGWSPPPGWRPDPRWPPAPATWEFWAPRLGGSVVLGAALDACLFVVTYSSLVGAHRIDGHDFMAFFGLWAMCVGVGVSSVLALMSPRSARTGLGMMVALPLPIILFICLQFLPG